MNYQTTTLTVSCDYCGKVAPLDEDQAPPDKWITYDRQHPIWLGEYMGSYAGVRISVGRGPLSFCGEHCRKEWLELAISEWAGRPREPELDIFGNKVLT